MPRTARVLAVLLACAALLLGGLTAAATAIASPAGPAADPPPSIAQLCAATGDQSIDALLDGVADTDLVGDLAPLLDLTVPQDQGRVLKADVDLDDVRTALNCTDDTPSTSTPPTSSTPAAPGDERDCSDFATRQDAQDFYDSRKTAADPDPSKLDQDGDGIACEVNEGAAGSGSGSGTSGSTSTGIDPTADDGSSTDGNTQVLEVPEGSASTGGGV